MKKTTLGLAMCGSFCTFSRVLDAFEALDRERFDLVPIMSQVSFETDSRFGPAAQFRERLEALCGREIVHTIEEAEPFGPKKLLDVLVIMPCTGNTLAKLASGIADGPVTLAAKAHLRNERPVIVAVSTNDGLAGNAANLGAGRYKLVIKICGETAYEYTVTVTETNSGGTVGDIPWQPDPWA